MEAAAEVAAEEKGVELAEVLEVERESEAESEVGLEGPRLRKAEVEGEADPAWELSSRLQVVKVGGCNKLEKVLITGKGFHTVSFPGGRA